MPLASSDRVRAKTHFMNEFKLIWAVQSCRKRYFTFGKSEIVHILTPSRLGKEGRYGQSSRNVERDAMDAMLSRDERR
jgi:hypothetical protein